MSLLLSQIICFDHRFHALLISPWGEKYIVLKKISASTFYYVTESIWSINDRSWIYIHIVKAVILCEYFYFLVFSIFHSLDCLYQDRSLHNSKRHCILWEWIMLCMLKIILVLKFFLEKYRIQFYFQVTTSILSVRIHLSMLPFKNQTFVFIETQK